MQSAGQRRNFTPEPFDNDVRLGADGGSQQDIDSGPCYVPNLFPALVWSTYYGEQLRPSRDQGVRQGPEGLRHTSDSAGAQAREAGPSRITGLRAAASWRRRRT